VLSPFRSDRAAVIPLSGGHALTEATVTALDASAALIVLCSTVSAGRPAVNEELRLFRSRHPDRPGRLAEAETRLGKMQGGNRDLP
jgi:hypothetical protein